METTATIRIDKKHIYDEISRQTSYIGAKDGNPDIYDRILITDEDNEYFERMFVLAHSECIGLLYPYTKNEITESPSNSQKQRSATSPSPDYDISGPEDTTETDVIYDIRLILPKHFSNKTVSLLENLIREYIINRLMSEWIMITIPEKHSYWIERCSSTKKQISTALTARTRPLKRTLSPF